MFFLMCFFSYHMISCRLEDKDVYQQVDSPRWVSSSYEQSIIYFDYSRIHCESQIGKASRSTFKKKKKVEIHLIQKYNTALYSMRNGTATGVALVEILRLHLYNHMYALPLNLNVAPPERNRAA